MNLFQRIWKTAISSRPHPGEITREAALDLAAAELRRASASYAGVALVLIDGRSGSGKTSFAAELSQRCPRAQVVHLDDLYPGWDGLEAGISRAQDIIGAWSVGEQATYTPTQWPGTAAREPISLAANQPVIVEGVGARHALPRGASEALVLPLYLDVPDTVRRDRALTRDGEAFAPYWSMWAEQEDADLARAPLTFDASRGTDILRVVE